MIFATLGYILLGGLVNQYGMPYLHEYIFSSDSTIPNNLNEYCSKCNVPTDLNFVHCDNCNRCHPEHHYRKCNLCSECVYLNEYNSHTKKICIHGF